MVAATHWFNLSAGVLKSSVFLGRSMQQINRELSNMNDIELARVPATLKAVKS